MHISDHSEISGVFGWVKIPKILPKKKEFRWNETDEDKLLEWKLNIEKECRKLPVVSGPNGFETIDGK